MIARACGVSSISDRGVFTSGELERWSNGSVSQGDRFCLPYACDGIDISKRPPSGSELLTEYADSGLGPAPQPQQLPQPPKPSPALAFSALPFSPALAPVAPSLTSLPSVTIASHPQRQGTGLSSGAKVGLAVGVCVAAVVVFAGAIVGIIIYRKRKAPHGNLGVASVDTKDHFNPSDSGVSDATGVTGASLIPASEVHSTVHTHSFSKELLSIQGLDSSVSYGHAAPGSLDGISAEWEIRADEMKIYCVKGRPIELGKGGYGIVVLGQVHREEAAIKMIKGRNERFEAAMLREVALLERAKTKYVTRFLGYSYAQEGILLAMELMRGGSLHAALRRGTEYQWYNRGQQAFTDVCRGLYMLHINQICHLDMKTPNVLIGEDGVCKISDLGLGRRMDPQASMVSTQEYATLAWMSPEHCNSGKIGLPSDVWALSTILWEICTLGEPTRQADPEDIHVPEQAPQEVVDLMRACRQTNPRHRPIIRQICDLLDEWSAPRVADA